MFYSQGIDNVHNLNLCVYLNIDEAFEAGTILNNNNTSHGFQ